MADGSNALRLNKADALRHVELITGSRDTEVYLRFLDDAKTGKTAAERKGSIENLWPELVAFQRDHYGVFLIVNQGEAKPGQFICDADIISIRACFADADDLSEPIAWHVAPSFIIRRDEQHWHAYWLVDDLTVTDFNMVQRQLAQRYGTDEKICNPSRVMRLAGSIHWKDPTNPRLVALDDWTFGAERSAHTAAELRAGLPEVEPTKRVEAHTTPSNVAWNEAGNIARGRSYLAGEVTAGRVAIEHDQSALGGNNTLLRVACQLRDFMISEDRAKELIRSNFNPFCQPPWDDATDETFMAPIRRAYHGGAQNREPGRDAVRPAEEAFAGFRAAQSAPESEGEAKTGDDGYRKLVEFYRGREPDEDENLPEIEFWDAERTIPKTADGAIIVPYGPFGHMKTTLLLADALDAMQKGARVVFAAGEGAHGMRKSRLPAACRARGLTTKDLRGKFRTCPAVPNLTNETEVNAFIEAFRDFRPDIVIIDTLATASGDVEENTDKFGKLLTSNGPVGRIKRAFRCTVLCIHHSGKDLERGSRGHSSVGGNADGLFQITADKEARTITKFVEKMRDGEDGFSVEYGVTAAGQVPVASKIGRMAHRSKTDSEDLLGWIITALTQKGIRGETKAVSAVCLSRYMLAMEDPSVPPEGMTLNLEQEQRRKAIERQVHRAAKEERDKFGHLVKRLGSHRTAPWLWSLPLAGGGAE